jgi:hypothetical protein
MGNQSFAAPSPWQGEGWGERGISTIGIVIFTPFMRLVSLVVQLSYGRSEIGRVS